MNLNASITTIMTTDVESVSPDQKIIEIKHIYEKPEFHSHVPVIENNKVVGIVSLVNFMRAIHNASLDDTEEVYHEILVKDIMTPSPSFVSPETTIKEVAEELSSGDYHSILILSDGELEGIVTTTDILRNIIEAESAQ